ncbi:MAG TPA: hypothetical protein VMP08_21000 [Anaerolineae bacterium]|nr:hypothetical protein [Anaerolineae bacterium]
MGIVLMLHSIVRWLVVLIAIMAALRFVLVMAGKAQSGGMDRGLMAGYTGLLDLNVLLGLVLIIGLGFTAQHIEHAVTNIIGVAVAHIFAQRAKKIEDAKLKTRTNLLGIVISILIIVVGVALVGGWAR